jgi:hypothetical protein
LRSDRDRFEEAGAHVVLVGMGSPEETASFKERFDIPFPMIADPDKKLYETFELDRISPVGFLSPTLFLKGLSAMTRGHTPGLPQGDVRQLPGVFIVDTGGNIIYSHYARSPSDHPDSGALLHALKPAIP